MDENLPEVWMQFLINLSRYIDSRVSFNGRHSAQVAYWGKATARKLAYAETDERSIFFAALLHDVGKIGVPDEILIKAGPLSAEEWTMMRLHPIVGANIVRSLKPIAHIAPLINAHQERYDGSGYPCGLKGDEIPLGARILAVVDAYEAMTNDRVYRKARSSEEATQELKHNGGTHFDPNVVDAFLQVVTTRPAGNAAFQFAAV
jgi:putative nucleotidyltransferase with HDIG domain